MLFASNAISISFTLSDLLFVFLAIAGIVALVYLVKLFASITKITDNISKTMEDNKSSIDATIKDLPSITTNVAKLLENTESMVGEVKPQVVSMLTDVNNVTSKISNVSTNISDTVEVVGLAAADTASNFSSKISNATDYIALVKSLISVLTKKK